MHTACRRGSVTLWTIGLKHEAMELCGDRHQVRLGGIGRMLMVQLNTIDPKLDVDFLMKYYLLPIQRSFFFRLFHVFFSDPFFFDLCFQKHQHQHQQ